MSQGPATNRPSSNTSHDQTDRSSTLQQSRTLPPIQQAILTSPSQEVYPKTLAIQNVSSRPTPPPSSTPPDQRSSRPIGVQNLLNPTAGDNANNQSRRRNAELLESSPKTASVGSMSRPATPSVSTTSVTRRSPADVSLPSITPPLMSVYPQTLGRAMTPRSPTTFPRAAGFPSATIDARQSPFVLPRDHLKVSSGPAPLAPADLGLGMPPNTYASTIPQSRSPPLRQNSRDNASFPRVSHPLDRPTAPVTIPPAPDSRSTSPNKRYTSYGQMPTVSAGAPPLVTTGQPQSFFQGSFAASGPASAMPQTAFDKKAFDASTSGTVGQNQYQLMTLETDQGPIQVPVDVQAASKVADEKRKRNATASHRFRQRRKEKEQETSENIAKLEAQIRDMAEEKEFYQRERDYFQEITLRNRIPVTARPPSPRRRRHASLGGPTLTHFEESDNGNRTGRNTRRRTSAYVPAAGPVPQAEAGPPMPPFERATSMSTENIQGGLRMRPFQPNPNPFHRQAPH